MMESLRLFARLFNQPSGPSRLATTSQTPLGLLYSALTLSPGRGLSYFIRQVCPHVLVQKKGQHHTRAILPLTVAARKPLPIF
jgi:hypothetical protein